MLAPPFILSDDQIGEIVDKLALAVDLAVTSVEGRRARTTEKMLAPGVLVYHRGVLKWRPLETVDMIRRQTLPWLLGTEIR